MRRLFASLCALVAISAVPARAEDGYELWLRYHPLVDATQARELPRAQAIASDQCATDPRIASAAAEIARATNGLLGRSAGACGTAAPAGSILLGTPASPQIRALRLDLVGLGPEGYVVRSVSLAGKPVTVVAANSGAGVLYGSFALIRQMQLGQPLDHLDLRSAPKLQLRVLDHWDNLDRHVERGYAGESIWNWWTLPDWKDPRYTDYARANASIGINGAVLNNVNSLAESLTPRYIAKAAALADVLRRWGIKVYLSARFSAPIELGHLTTADPLDPDVAAWWRAKADEIYRAIPDFGGFLVKANSEGQPGPQDYHRSHADGANVIADAVRPHGGVVMYRAFVYSQDNAEDRAKQAYDDFKPLDGKFAANVIVQVKNGPIDFQPREPFHPLFGQMPRTPLMIEFQITKEYLGQATHLTYLGPLFAETLASDTMERGAGSTVAKVIEGKLDGQALTGMAGVANIGSDRDWSGSTFNQADWYAFGRLAWDPEADPQAIAADWVRLTFTSDPRFVQPVVAMMMGSREAAVNYMTPLGLAHQMATGHHYGPGPWIADLARPEWNPAYYNRADRNGIGFDRTASGSNAVAQYRPAVARMFGNVATTPEAELLWFHHLGWDAPMRSGRTLWEELAAHYDAGVAAVDAMERTWGGLADSIDAERYAKTAAFLRIQAREARWWRDASLAYYSSVSGRPLPPGVPPPTHPLAYYEALRFPEAPGQAH